MTEPKKEECEACCGDGYIGFWTDDGHISLRTCRRCDGYGYIKVKQMTNEERLRSTDTRGLAKELALLVLYDMPLYDRLHNVFEGGESAVIDECEKWLKEEHQ